MVLFRCVCWRTLLPWVFWSGPYTWSLVSCVTHSCPACSCWSKPWSTTRLFWATPSSMLSLETRAPTTSSQTGKAFFCSLYVRKELPSVCSYSILLWSFSLWDSWQTKTNFALFNVSLFFASVPMRFYRTSVLSQGLGFNTNSLSALSINITSPGRTLIFTTLTIFTILNSLLTVFVITIKKIAICTLQVSINSKLIVNLTVCPC